ncbi:MAG TPA: nuclear transport factor 2 family protein, partial [Longimicrobiaceae bacterium]|nr:nuclear transport factor 2 family protein [Longimicrobiaceae bacterium]
MRFLTTLLAAAALLSAAPLAAQSTAPAGDARLEANKAVVRQLYERVFNGHDVDAADRLLRADYIQHNPNIPTGREGFKATFRDVFKLVPDARVQILHMVAEGDLVVVHVLNSGTPGGTSEPVQAAGFDLFRIQDGLIAEHWDTTLSTPPRPAGPPAAPVPPSPPPPPLVVV